MSQSDLVERLEELQRFNIGVPESVVALSTRDPTLTHVLALLRSKFTEAGKLLAT